MRTRAIFIILLIPFLFVETTQLFAAAAILTVQVTSLLFRKKETQ